MDCVGTLGGCSDALRDQIPTCQCFGVEPDGMLWHMCNAHTYCNAFMIHAQKPICFIHRLKGPSDPSGGYLALGTNQRGRIHLLLVLTLLLLRYEFMLD